MDLTNEKVTLKFADKEEKEEEDAVQVGYNKHFLKIVNGLANEKQVSDMLDDAYKQALKYVPDLIGGFIINLIPNLGYGFVWLMDERFVNMLLGKNPDGTERLEVIYNDSDRCRKLLKYLEIDKPIKYRILPFLYGLVDDPEKCPAPIFKKALSRWSKEYSWSPIESDIKKVNPNTPIRTWGAEANIENQIKQECIKTKPLPSLLNLKGYWYNRKDIPKISRYKGPITLGEFKFEEKLPKIHNYSNTIRFVLICDNVPQYITKRNIVDLFYPFVSEGFEYLNYKNQQEPYPIVIIEGRNNRNVAYIMFSPSTWDSSYALEMRRRSNINGITIFFRYATKKDWLPKFILQFVEINKDIDKYANGNDSDDSDNRSY
jgi:hypothetical protein